MIQSELYCSSASNSNILFIITIIILFIVDYFISYFIIIYLF